LLIDDLDIPPEVKEVLAKSGYRELYPPQEMAVKKGALEGRRLVLASPTASGKTLVSELCALKHIMERGGKVLYLTPLRALAAEKYADFQKYRKLEKRGGGKIRVALSTGDYDSSDPHLARYDLIVTTNEKADSLLRHRAEWMGSVSLLVADEVHLLHEPDRGPTLEVTLTRLKQLSPQLQILALSATIENAEEIAEWLEADCVALDWRPVPLREGVHLYDEVQFKDGGSRKVSRLHPNSAVNLALQTVKEGGQALIFAEARRVAVNLAQKAVHPVKKLLSKSELRVLKKISEEILSVGERTQLSETLSSMVEGGVAVHHAGIHAAHRKIVEDNFRRGLIKIVAATPTLAAGVNLPARTVVINSYIRYEPGLGRTDIPVFEYKQMAGRAGRPLYDKEGEAILLASTPDEHEFLMEYYVCSKPERIWSKLAVERVLRSHVLATIASGFAKTEQGLSEFFNQTFYAHQYGEKIVQRPVGAALNYLAENELVCYEARRLEATPFGKRTSELYIDPVTAVVMKQAFLQEVKLPTEVGLLHLIAHTPDILPRLYPYRREMESLENFLREHERELFFDPPSPQEDFVEYEDFLGELKCVKVLHYWIQEARENDLLEFFRVEPGDLYRLVERAEWLLYAAEELAKLFKRKELLPTLSQLRLRVKHGVKPELLPLVAIPGVGRIRARALYNSGFKTVEDLKQASLPQLTSVPGIGLKLAEGIKAHVGGLIKRKELEAAREAGVQESLEAFASDKKGGEN